MSGKNRSLIQQTHMLKIQLFLHLFCGLYMGSFFTNLDLHIYC
jgi:hypothetical protein